MRNMFRSFTFLALLATLTLTGGCSLLYGKHWHELTYLDFPSSTILVMQIGNGKESMADVLENGKVTIYYKDRASIYAATPEPEPLTKYFIQANGLPKSGGNGIRITNTNADQVTPTELVFRFPKSVDSVVVAIGKETSKEIRPLERLAFRY